MLAKLFVQSLLEDAHPRGHQERERQRPDTYKTKAGYRTPARALSRYFVKRHLLTVYMSYRNHKLAVEYAQNFKKNITIQSLIGFYISLSQDHNEYRVLCLAFFMIFFWIFLQAIH